MVMKMLFYDNLRVGLLCDNRVFVFTDPRPFAWPTALVPNLYLPTLAPNLYLPALAPNVC